jgi:cytochrome P450
MFLNPWRYFKLWQNCKLMDDFLLPSIKNRIYGQGASNMADKPTKKTLVDMLVQAMADNNEDESTFIPYALGEIKHTMFAGHETTAFTLGWTFLMLSKYPNVLARMREEQESILGNDPAAALRESPHLINSLVYTNAVIKETMRIHTNVGTLRQGTAQFSLYGTANSGFEGVCFPTVGCVVWDANFAIHRNPTLWAQPLEFVPERWLVTEEDPLYPPKNGYRPFVQGARNCVGQHLAMTEIRLALCLIINEVDVECAWDKWDASR